MQPTPAPSSSHHSERLAALLDRNPRDPGLLVAVDVDAGAAEHQIRSVLGTSHRYVKRQEVAGVEPEIREDLAKRRSRSTGRVPDPRSVRSSDRVVQLSEGDRPAEADSAVGHEPDAAFDAEVFGIVLMRGLISNPAAGVGNALVVGPKSADVAAIVGNG